jgi:hypothetical protein
MITFSQHDEYAKGCDKKISTAINFAEIHSFRKKEIGLKFSARNSGQTFTGHVRRF